ncbi:MAG TPA: FUSC family protein, partial [Castellaniella sp.]|nr:FUSC family protein [Castellaniella sp.]
VRRQRHVPALNRLLIQHHTLASQIAAVIPHLARMDGEPRGIAQAIETTLDLLQDRDATPPNVIETEGDLASIAYPLRQMTKAAQVIRENMSKLEPTASPAPSPQHRAAAG